MRHLVLIGDLVASRKAPDRAALQKRLQSAVKLLNKKRSDQLRSPFTITLGDEFQSVYKDAQTAFADLFFLLHALAPARIRFALATGDIATKINRTQAIGMDGPAFHEARAILDHLKADRRLFGVGGVSPQSACWVRPALAVLSGLVEGWRDTRLLLMAGLLDGENTETLARRTGITVRAVNKNIRAADLDEWETILHEIERLLSEVSSK